MIQAKSIDTSLDVWGPDDEFHERIAEHASIKITCLYFGVRACMPLKKRRKLALQKKYAAMCIRPVASRQSCVGTGTLYSTGPNIVAGQRKARIRNLRRDYGAIGCADATNTQIDTPVGRGQFQSILPIVQNIAGDFTLKTAAAPSIAPLPPPATSCSAPSAKPPSGRCWSMALPRWRDQRLRWCRPPNRRTASRRPDASAASSATHACANPRKARKTACSCCRSDARPDTPATAAPVSRTAASVRIGLPASRWQDARSHRNQRPGRKPG